MDSQSSGSIRWSLIRSRAPGTLSQMIDDIESACGGNADDPAREIDLAFREQLSQLRAAFELLKAKEALP